MNKTIVKKAIAFYSSLPTKQADILIRLFSRFQRIRQFLWENLEIGETSQHHFFNDPNPVSFYGINILFTKNGTPYTSKMSAFSRFGQTLLDEKAKILVYTIPKVGSTTLKNFAKYELHLVDSLNEKVHRIKFPGIIDRSIQIPGSRALIKWDDYRNYDQYIVMRQPYEKILSFFTNKLVGLVKHNHEPSLYRLNFMDHLSKAGQGSQKMISSDALELSFDIFIRRLKYHYDHGNKLWDEHLALQISSDFENIALDKVKVLPLSKLNDFLDDWYFKRYGERKDCSSKKENASYGNLAPIFIENAHLMPVKELIKIENAIDPKSFYQAELEDVIKEMYAVDYKIWNSIKE